MDIITGIIEPMILINAVAEIEEDVIIQNPFTDNIIVGTGDFDSNITSTDDVIDELISAPAIFLTEFIESEATEYTGGYVATPTVNTQTFSTHGKFISEDFIVNPIPITRTPNSAGGISVKIGG